MLLLVLVARELYTVHIAILPLFQEVAYNKYDININKIEIDLYYINLKQVNDIKLVWRRY